MQKIAADDAKRKVDKQKERDGGKRSYNQANPGLSTRKLMLWVIQHLLIKVTFGLDLSYAAQAAILSLLGIGALI